MSVMHPLRKTRATPELCILCDYRGTDRYKHVASAPKISDKLIC